MRVLPPTDANIELAAQALRQGKLVGMPTETVYGVAANALDPAAVRATFTAKGRPADNPLIVHLADATDVSTVAAAFPAHAQELARRFWPGPLTLVLPKRSDVPEVTTGGLGTVAVRVPAHPAARALIAAAGVPLSAPSANLFMGLSPTRAEHIDPSLAEHLALILDGGPCEVGLESTVVDATGPTIRLLRPGRVTQSDLEDALGEPVLAGQSKERRSPGQYPRHYAPRTPVRLVDHLPEGEPGIARLDDPEQYAAALYAALHDLDHLGLPEILVERPPKSAEWAAVWDRLKRAT
ncbi:L-threonylcarbamoyladenylate synthase [Fimbriimonas ginsengisoli]|uniref:Threonylcarbamoyl-AMP synthase n=1 Tax=Fimbriimonas ginsengisoli Gsoil 348 TaxID=661478 RepID=A0A068NS26_FIMGI|nr:L-threonylcarbamoyladenylate synthase [Fimbriimonas ginsengisoli]AIE84419.1 translation factor SUA5 [Fimbriimonas ginsengisoli Gsoil 348]